MRPPRRERNPVNICERVKPVDKTPTINRIIDRPPITDDIIIIIVCTILIHSISACTSNGISTISTVIERALYRQPQNTPVPTIVIIVAIIDANGHRPTQPVSIERER